MDTFPSLFSQQVRTRSNDPSIRYKRHGLWKTWSWGEVGENVQNFACGLASHGLKPNENVAIIGNNIPQLYFGMLAVQCLGAVPVPIHPDSNAEELVYALNKCGAKLALVQDQQQVDGCYEIKDQCPSFEQMIYCDGRGMQEYQSSRLHKVEDVQEAGRKFASEHPTFLDDIRDKTSHDSSAFILFTAGTTDKPRGVIHTHESLIGTATAFADQEKIQQDDESLAFMPLSYAANILFTYSLWLLKGLTINCPENNETVMVDFREIGPTIAYAPPHFYKQLYSEITARAQRSNAKYFDTWFGYARKSREKLLDGGQQSGGLNSLLGNLLMFAPLKNVYGLSKLRQAYTGGDVMSSEVFNFFRGIGVNLKKCYGTTESAGFICVQDNAQADSRSGENSMGAPLSGVEVKALEDGELAFKGVNTFKEYINDPAATSAIRTADGLVRTGDVGEVDSNGVVKVTDRTDSVGKFTSGSLFAPHRIESELKSSPYIKEAVALGEGQESIATFIVIDDITVGSWAEANNIRFTGYADLATKDEVYNLVKEHVDSVNAKIKDICGDACPPISRFLLMHREFNVDSGEVTRSHKIRRDVVMGRHQTLVDALYSSQQKVELRDDASGETIAELKLESA